MCGSGQRSHANSQIIILSLIAFVIFAWGLNWTVTRYVVGEITPFWTSALRTWIAVVVLAALLVVSGQMTIPKKGDFGIVIAIGFFHMTAFSGLMTLGLKYLPVGRSIVLAYTTPIWVVPLAYAFLGERFTLRRILALILALAGVVVLLNPLAFDWSGPEQRRGCVLLLTAALAWSVSIVYTRAHRWVTDPFQLVFWEALLAAICLTGVAFYAEPLPSLALSQTVVGGLLFSGVIGTALAYWAMAVINRSMSAMGTLLSMLGVPVVGILSASLVLQESIEWLVVLSGALILIGVIQNGVEASTVSQTPPNERH